MSTTDYLLGPVDGFTPDFVDLTPSDIYFLLDKTPQQLNLQWLYEHPDLLSYLVTYIARNPKNLVTHIQRICACYQANLSEHLYGAVIDLFTVLDGCAQEFKAKMLVKVKPKLIQSHVNLLEAYLQEEDILTLYLVQNPFAILSKGLMGTTQLVTRPVNDVNRQPEANSQDPLQQAREYIEYADFHEAQNVLEAAILEEPQRKALHLELLAIYKSLQDVDSFVMFSEILEHEGNPFPMLWQQTSDFFVSKSLLSLGRSSTN